MAQHSRNAPLSQQGAQLTQDRKQRASSTMPGPAISQLEVTGKDRELLWFSVSFSSTQEL